MGRNRKKWYVIAYDIRNEKRLRRLHYYLKKEAVALQKSVFLLSADAEGRNRVKAEIKSRVNNREDDVRIYPVFNPDTLWVAGLQRTSLSGLYGGSSGQVSESAGVKGFFKKIFKRKRI
ncbi:MAG: CRISPR-associated endonuclease Cas2 [Gammaproteobacteria bacterium]|nr:MAG: CRISPR-associated endonuclease Cas2 [Gammaproteobacteria bacterium]